MVFEETLLFLDLVFDSVSATTTKKRVLWSPRASSDGELERDEERCRPAEDSVARNDSDADSDGGPSQRRKRRHWQWARTFLAGLHSPNSEGRERDPKGQP